MSPVWVRQQERQDSRSRECRQASVEAAERRCIPDADASPSPCDSEAATFFVFALLIKAVPYRSRAPA